MIFDQFLFLFSTFTTSASCFVLLKLAIWFIPGATRLEVLADLDAATNIMDPNAILAFIVGLVASIGVLIYISSGSESSSPSNLFFYQSDLDKSSFFNFSLLL